MSIEEWMNVLDDDDDSSCDYKNMLVKWMNQ